MAESAITNGRSPGRNTTPALHSQPGIFNNGSLRYVNASEKKSLLFETFLHDFRQERSKTSLKNKGNFSSTSEIYPEIAHRFRLLPSANYTKYVLNLGIAERFPLLEHGIYGGMNNYILWLYWKRMLNTIHGINSMLRSLMNI